MFFGGCQKGADESGNKEQKKVNMVFRSIMHNDILEEGSNTESSQQETLDAILLKKEYPDVPEAYWMILEQYESILKVDVEYNDVVEEFYDGGKWEYVWSELYVQGNHGVIYYSLEDLTNDGFPEMIMGLENRGYENEISMNIYVIYYIEEDSINQLNFASGPTTLHENSIIRTGFSGISAPWMFLQYQVDTRQWEKVAYVEYVWENGEIIGYSKGEDYELISEEQYNEIIDQYTTDLIELDWIPLYELSDR